MKGPSPGHQSPRNVSENKKTRLHPTIRIDNARSDGHGHAHAGAAQDPQKAHQYDAAAAELVDEYNSKRASLFTAFERAVTFQQDDNGSHDVEDDDSEVFGGHRNFSAAVQEDEEEQLTGYIDIIAETEVDWESRAMLLKLQKNSKCLDQSVRRLDTNAGKLKPFAPPSGRRKNPLGHARRRWIVSTHFESTQPPAPLTSSVASACESPRASKFCPVVVLPNQTIGSLRPWKLPSRFKRPLRPHLHTDWPQDADGPPPPPPTTRSPRPESQNSVVTWPLRPNSCDRNASSCSAYKMCGSPESHRPLSSRTTATPTWFMNDLEGEATPAHSLCPTPSPDRASPVARPAATTKAELSSLRGNFPGGGHSNPESAAAGHYSRQPIRYFAADGDDDDIIVPGRPQNDIHHVAWSREEAQERDKWHQLAIMRQQQALRQGHLHRLWQTSGRHTPSQSPDTGAELPRVAAVEVDRVTASLGENGVRQILDMRMLELGDRHESPEQSARHRTAKRDRLGSWSQTTVHTSPWSHGQSRWRGLTSTIENRLRYEGASLIIQQHWREFRKSVHRRLQAKAIAGIAAAKNIKKKQAKTSAVETVNIAKEQEVRQTAQNLIEEKTAPMPKLPPDDIPSVPTNPDACLVHLTRLGNAEKLLASGACERATKLYLCQALFIAARAGALPILELLLKRTGVEAVGWQDGKETLLHIAARHDRVAVCQWLQDKGANVLAPDRDGNMPWQVAGARASQAWDSTSASFIRIGRGDQNLRGRGSRFKEPFQQLKTTQELADV